MRELRSGKSVDQKEGRKKGLTPDGGGLELPFAWEKPDWEDLASNLLSGLFFYGRERMGLDGRGRRFSKKSDQTA